MTDYIALIMEDKKAAYNVIFPDFPGCQTTGHTIAGAKRMAREVLAGHIKVMQADGAMIPFPSSFSEIMNNPAYRETLAFEVSVSCLFTEKGLP